MASGKTGKFTQGAAQRIANAVRYVEGIPGDNLPTPGERGRRQPPQMTFAVRVSIDGGSAGDADTDCSWTYTVTSDAGFQYGTAMTPAKCRLPGVPYAETPDDTWGTGFFDKDGEFVLWDANECEEVEAPCDPTSSPILGGSSTTDDDPGFGPGFQETE